MLKYALLLALAACADDGAVAFDDQIEAGSTWRLILGPGTGDNGFSGACPAFAPMARHVPDDTGDCAPGCTCSLRFWIEGGDDVFGSSYVSSDFQLHCTDGTELSCSGDDVQHSAAVGCLWARSSAEIGDCTYGGQLVPITLVK